MVPRNYSGVMLAGQTATGFPTHQMRRQSRRGVPPPRRAVWPPAASVGPPPPRTKTCRCHRPRPPRLFASSPIEDVLSGRLLKAFVSLAQAVCPPHPPKCVARGMVLAARWHDRGHCSSAIETQCSCSPELISHQGVRRNATTSKLSITGALRVAAWEPVYLPNTHATPTRGAGLAPAAAPPRGCPRPERRCTPTR